MNYYILALVIVILCYSVYKYESLNNMSITEGYDASFRDQSFEACAEFCKTTAGCLGFGYDQKSKICYPSKTSISGRPVGSLFRSEYNYNNATCNKIKAVMEAGKGIPFSDRRNNSVYICSESSDKFPQYYFHNNGTFTNIGEGKVIDDIFDVEDYEVKTYKWPVNKFDYDQLDLLIKERENQEFVSDNVTQINRILDTPILPTQQETPVTSSAINKQQTSKPGNQEQVLQQNGKQLDFGLERVNNGLQSINNRIKKVSKNLKLIAQNRNTQMVQSKTSNKKNTNKDQYIVYKQYNDFNTGEYSKDFKCVRDIPYNDCAEYCTNDDNCVGFEFNTMYPINKNITKNVCCPYKSKG